MYSTVGVILQLTFACLSVSDSDLSNTCHRRTSTLTCDNDLPDPIQIPEGITAIHVQEYKWDWFKSRKHIFKHIKWQEVRELKIVKNIKNGFRLELSDKDFFDLNKLETFIIHSTELKRIEPLSFIGLHHLNVLDLSSCPNLNIKVVLNALKSVNLTFKLELLNLNMIGHNVNSIITFNNEFTTVLHQREVKRLIMRDTNILLRYIDLSLKPFLLEYVDFSQSNLYLININKDKVPIYEARRIYYESFKFLKFLNVSGINLAKMTPENVPTYCNISSVVLQFVKTLDISNIFNKRWIFTETMDVSCFTKMKSLFASMNNLYIFNATVFWPPFLEYLDISSNGLELLSIRTLQGLDYLKHLDFSNNLLFKMENSSEFQDLFSNLLSLEFLNLGNNSLTSLPVILFEKNTKLRMLDLKNNNLKTVSFIPDTLTTISVLDLQNNKISYLSETELNTLNTLIDKVNLTNKTGVTINLLDNTVACECKNLKFIKWIASKLQTKTNLKYTCSLDGNIVYVNDESLETTEYNCYRTVIIIASSIFSVVTTFVSALIVYRLYTRRRQTRSQNIVNHFIEKLLKGCCEENYLVFISYSSDDVQFVMDWLEPAIKDHFKYQYNMPSEFIVTGDTTFRFGHPILSEIMRCIQLSCVVVCFISKSFCESDWCETELREAVQQHKPTILLFKEDIEKKNMSDFVRMLFNRNARAKLELKDNVYVPIGGWAHFCECAVKLASDVYNSHKRNEKRTNKRRDIRDNKHQLGQNDISDVEDKEDDVFI